MTWRGTPVNGLELVLVRSNFWKRVAGLKVEGVLICWVSGMFGEKGTFDWGIWEGANFY